VLTSRQRGVTLTEMMIGIAVVGILMVLALPNFTVFLQNAQIKNAAEGVLQGLNIARQEAIRRNTTVRFQFVSDLTSGCALSSSKLSWIVSLQDPTGKCDIAASDTIAPQTVQKQSATEGTLNVVAAATGGTTVVFSGLGRVSGAGITQVDLSNSQAVCEHVSASGTVRCLRVLISSGGQAKLCDPKVTAASDSRFCS